MKLIRRVNRWLAPGVPQQSASPEVWCARCLYHIHFDGAPSASTCPECGATVDPQVPSTMWRQKIPGRFARMLMRAPGLWFLAIVAVLQGAICWNESLPGGQFVSSIFLAMGIMGMVLSWVLRIMFATVVAWRFRLVKRVTRQVGWLTAPVGVACMVILAANVDWLYIRLWWYQRQLEELTTARESDGSVSLYAQTEAYVAAHDNVIAGVLIDEIDLMASSAGPNSSFEHLADAMSGVPGVEVLKTSKGFVLWRANYSVFGDRFGLAFAPERDVCAVLASQFKDLGGGWFQVQSFRRY